MTKAEHQALMSRSEAFNARYGNAVTRLTPAEFAAIWNAGGHRLEPQELVAVVTRSEALNDEYDWRDFVQNEPRTGYEPGIGSEPPSPPVATGFGWSDAGIGAAAMLGLVLLAGGLGVAARHGRRVASPRVS
jgi:hypothetical protein